MLPSARTRAAQHAARVVGERDRGPRAGAGARGQTAPVTWRFAPTVCGAEKPAGAAAPATAAWSRSATEEGDARVKRLRFHGSKDKVVFDEVGYNSRLDDLQDRDHPQR